MVVEKFHVFLGAVQKCSDARRAKNRTVKRIWIYVERCGLQRNTADERFSTAPLSLLEILPKTSYINLHTD
jgi:hypothetical protein